jgi:drug/metabolite transporter (DMT)-like permease
LPRLHFSPYLLLTLTSLFWSLNWVVGRALVGTVSPFTLALIRWTVAVVLLVAISWRQLRDHWPAIVANRRRIVFLGFWGTGLHNAFSYLGLQYTTATNGVILNSAIPVMIIVCGWMVFRDTITRLQAVGVAISLAGVLTVLTRGDIGVLARFSLNGGDLIVLFAMVFWAVYTVFLRTKPDGIPGLALIACCGTVGIAILLPMAAIELVFLGGTLVFTPASVAAMLYVGIFPSLLGYIFWNRAVAEVGSNVAGVFVHLMPAFGSLLAWMFLGERIYAYHLAGIGLILAGIALTSRGARGTPAPGPE